jgi:hypothetical protein
MMHRSKKLLGSGDQEYFKEKRPVNVRVDGAEHLAELFPCARILTNTSHHRGSVRMVGNPYSRIMEGLPVTRPESGLANPRFCKPLLSAFRADANACSQQLSPNLIWNLICRA